MPHLMGIVLATIVVFVPALRGQCVDCADKWHASCHTSETGYYCELGAVLYEDRLPPKVYETSSVDPREEYSECVPYPYHLEYVKKYCCFWSPDLGCQMAINPMVYTFGNPTDHCNSCKMRCPCKSLRIPLQPWHWATLGCLSIVLTQFL